MTLTYSLKALPWDIAIILLIAGGAAVALLPLWERRLPFRVPGRLRFLVRTLGALLALVVLYGSFVEPRIITVTEETVVLPTTEHMTIVVVADWHVGPFKGERFVRRAVERINALEPDLVLMPGDFVYHGIPDEEMLLPLKDLFATYGVYASMGNHEYSCYWGRIRADRGIFDVAPRIERAFERMNITVLRNSWAEVETEDGPLYIAGVDDMCSARENLDNALPPIQQKAPVILLSHDPSIILDNRATYPHLVVSGHTHGGQVRLPFIGPLSPLPTQLGRSYDQGVFPVDNNTTLAITRGIGESGARARLFAPPEILVLRNVVEN